VQAVFSWESLGVLVSTPAKLIILCWLAVGLMEPDWRWCLLWGEGVRAVLDEYGDACRRCLRSWMPIVLSVHSEFLNISLRNPITVSSKRPIIDTRDWIWSGIDRFSNRLILDKIDCIWSCVGRFSKRDMMDWYWSCMLSKGVNDEAGVAQQAEETERVEEAEEATKEVEIAGD
jgi:hypothetical protein